MEALGTRLAAMLAGFTTRVREKLQKESGMATLETVLLIAILVALALMFKDTIVEFVEGILDGISSQGSSFDPASIVP